MSGPTRTGALVVPEYGGGSIANLSASVLAAFGAEPPSAPLRADLGVAQPLAAGAEAGGIVLLVLDALGLGQLEAALASGRVPRLAQVVGQAPGGLRHLTSVFPSTTTAALTSLATACPPAVHGILGHMLYLEEVGAVCNLLRFTAVTGGDPAPIDEGAVERQPTVYQRLAAAGVVSWVITAFEYEGTPFTNLLQEGGRFLGYWSPSQLCFQLAQALEGSGGRSAFYSLYWPCVDNLSHYYGPDGTATPSEACRLEMEFVDLMVGKVADLCHRHACCLVVVADHGQTRLDPGQAWTLDGSLRRRLDRAPGGGRRALYLSGPDPGSILQDEGLSAATRLLLPSDQAVAEGWFGGGCDRFRPRLGDVVALAGDGLQLLYDYGKGTRTQLGSHGGLTPEEMVVPLVVVPPT